MSDHVDTRVGEYREPSPCFCGAVSWDVTATLIACRRCGRLWGRVNGAWVLDPDTVPPPSDQPPPTPTSGAPLSNDFMARCTVHWTYWKRHRPDLIDAIWASHAALIERVMHLERECYRARQDDPAVLLAEIASRGERLAVVEAERDAAQAQVVKLREALWQCADWTRDHLVPLEGHDDQRCCPACIARAALAETEGP